MSGKIDIGAVLDRIKEAYRLDNDADLADFLGLRPTTMSSWRNRNSKLNINILYAKCENIDFHWLLTGRGEMFENPLNRKYSIPAEKRVRIASDVKGKYGAAEPDHPTGDQGIGEDRNLIEQAIAAMEQRHLLAQEQYEACIRQSEELTRILKQLSENQPKTDYADRLQAIIHGEPTKK